MEIVRDNNEQELNTKDTIKPVDTPNQPTKPEVKFYDYAHLVVYCGKCGSKYVLEENVPKNKGIQIVLPPTSTSEMRLICKECKNEMGLFYVESSKKDDPTVKEGDTNESVQETSTIKE